MLDFIQNEYVRKGVSAVITLFVGMIALKIAGKKSISQMTLPIIMFVLLIGSVLGSYLAKPQKTDMMIFVVFLILIIMFSIEKATQKWNFIDKILIGDASVIIKDGKLLKENISKNRLTVDQVEMELRLKSVPSIEVIKMATLEPNGQVAIEMMEGYDLLKKNELNYKLDKIYEAITDEKNIPKKENTKKFPSIFEEIENQENIQTSSKEDLE